MPVHKGIITQVMNHKSDFRIRYTADDGVIENDVGIEKEKTTQSDFIAASVGKPIEVMTDSTNYVTNIKIGDVQILRR